MGLRVGCVLSLGDGESMENFTLIFVDFFYFLDLFGKVRFTLFIQFTIESKYSLVAKMFKVITESRLVNGFSMDRGL